MLNSYEVSLRLNGGQLNYSIGEYPIDNNNSALIQSWTLGKPIGCADYVNVSPNGEIIITEGMGSNESKIGIKVMDSLVDAFGRVKNAIKTRIVTAPLLENVMNVASQRLKQHGTIDGAVALIGSIYTDSQTQLPKLAVRLAGSGSYRVADSNSKNFELFLEPQRDHDRNVANSLGDHEHQLLNTQQLHRLAAAGIVQPVGNSLTREVILFDKALHLLSTDGSEYMFPLYPERTYKLLRNGGLKNIAEFAKLAQLEKELSKGYQDDVAGVLIEYMSKNEATKKIDYERNRKDRNFKRLMIGIAGLATVGSIYLSMHYNISRVFEHIQDIPVPTFLKPYINDSLKHGEELVINWSDTNQG